MTIPKHDEIRVEALKLLVENETLKLKDFEIPLAKLFNLTDEELNEKYKSGKTEAKIFYDRIGWALSYLNMAGLVEKPKRAIYKITDIGLKLLGTPEQIEEYVANKIKDRNKDKSEHIDSNKIIANENIDATPSEAIERAFMQIKDSVYTEIIDTIISKTPREFEKLVVELLQKMGYGGEIENSGEVTKQSNDEGIDGIIKEDILGFGRIYIQAKRYSRDNKIGREHLNKFVGALATAQSSKGVFITTSSFNKNALEYANRLTNNTTLVLIDGDLLAKYIYDYSLGMQTEQIIEIKKLDSDFWDMLDDEIE